MAGERQNLANSEADVSRLYKNRETAKNYVEKRLTYSWQRLLHDRQVSAINRIIQEYGPENVLEIAPGPARLTTDIVGIANGALVEYSKEMLNIAKERLKAKGLSDLWTIIHGNAFELSHIGELRDVFDFIYTFRFIRHFRKQDRARLYEEIRAKLRPGGHLMVDVVNRVIRRKLDMKADKPPEGTLAVYDATFTKRSFALEMQQNGFHVLFMEPILHYYPLQSFLSYKLDDIVPTVIMRLVSALEHIPSRQPLEWVALCRRT